MKRMNKKGFTLIELLAVIIILGVLMIIAIPSVTTYIQNSRKSAYVDTCAAYVEAVRTKVNEGKDFRLFATDTLYLIPVGDRARTTTASSDSEPVAASCVSVESGGQSPFSEKWNYAYVGVTYDGKGYNYFFVGEDGAGQGLTFMPFKVLTDEGTGLIYSSTSDEEYTTAGTGVKAHTAMNETLHTALKNAYSAKDLRKYVPGSGSGTTAVAEVNSLNIDTSGTGNSYEAIQTIVGSEKTVIEVLGECHN